MAHPLRPTSALHPWWAGFAIAMVLAGCVPTAGTAQTPAQEPATASPTTASPAATTDATTSTGGTVVPDIHF